MKKSLVTTSNDINFLFTAVVAFSRNPTFCGIFTISKKIKKFFEKSNFVKLVFFFFSFEAHLRIEIERAQEFLTRAQARAFEVEH